MFLVLACVCVFRGRGWICVCVMRGTGLLIICVFLCEGRGGVKEDIHF